VFNSRVSRAVAVAAAVILCATSVPAADQPAPAAKPAAKPADKPAAKPAKKADGKAAPKPADQPAAAAAVDPKAAVAKVNGVVITQGEYDRNWKFFLQRSGIPVNHADKSGQVNEFRVQVLDRLVDEELLYQAAKDQKLVATAEAVQAELDKARTQFPTPEAFAEALVKNELTEDGLRALFTRNLSIQGYVEGHIGKSVTVSDAEVHDFYASNKGTFETPEQVRARHILVGVAAGDDAAVRAEKRKKAEGLLEQLKGGADFAELAKTGSECPSAPEGGDLGFFERGRMAPAFEEAAFALKPGELSGVVETEFGYHIIKLEERKAAGLVPEEEVAPKIREFLTAQKTEAAVEEKLKQLRAAAKIEKLMKL
jgi:peptidyl-prolyl cis-trans isomerase C